jgi:hypothetical protein
MRCILGLALLLIPAGVFANPITWDLENVTFFGGDAITGSFTYDADTNRISNWSLDATSLGGFPLFIPLTPGSSCGNLCSEYGASSVGTLGGNSDYSFEDLKLYYYFLDPPDLSESIEETFHIVTTNPLTDAGGVVPLVLTPDNTFALGLDGTNISVDVYDGSSGYTESYMVSGELAAESPASVPEPGTVVLAALGLAVVAWRGRR